MKHRIVSVTDQSKHPLLIIVMLAWPIFVEQVLVSLVQSVDTAMVGALGANATASVSISQSPINLINSVIMALGVGFTTMIARAVGAKQFEYARKLIRQSIVVVFSLGIPLSVLCFVLSRQIPIWMGGAPEILDDAQSYIRIIAFSMLFRGLMMVLTAIFRGFGDSRTPMIINIGINLLNVVGNYLLIYSTHDVTLFGHTFTVWGAGWGVAGAALSTSGSQILGSLVLLFMCFTPRSGPMRISIHESFRPSKETIQEVFRVSLPVMFERFTTSGAFVITSSIIASLGTISLAANSLAGQAESLSFMPGFAFGTAVTTLVGQSLGADNVPLARKYVRLSGIIGSVVMFIMSIFLFIFSDGIISIFTPDAAVIELGGQLLAHPGPDPGAADAGNGLFRRAARCGRHQEPVPHHPVFDVGRAHSGLLHLCPPVGQGPAVGLRRDVHRQRGPLCPLPRPLPAGQMGRHLRAEHPSAKGRNRQRIIFINSRGTEQLLCPAFFHGRGCKTCCPSRQICLFSRLKSPLICAILLL